MAYSYIRGHIFIALICFLHFVLFNAGIFSCYNAKYCISPILLTVCRKTVRIGGTFTDSVLYFVLLLPIAHDRAMVCVDYRAS